MEIVFFILAVILVLIILLIISPQKFLVMAVLDRDTNGIYYSFSHSIFKLAKGKLLFLDDGTVSVIDEKNKLFNSSIEPQLGVILASEMLKTIKLTNLYISYANGEVIDAFVTALLSGSLYTIAGNTRTMIESLDLPVEIDLLPTFGDEKVTLSALTHIRASLLSMTIAVIKSKKQYNKIKEDKQYAETKN